MVNCDGITIPNLEHVAIQKMDVSMSRNMSFSLPVQLRVLCILECQNVKCLNIDRCIHLPEQIRKDYGNNQYEKISRDQCVVC